MIIQEVKEEILYHICIYQDFMLDIGKTYNTNCINRIYKNCSAEKIKDENEFESIRVNNYPTFPSRQKCYYLCQEKDVELWLKELKRNNKHGHRVFKIACSGKIFWANSWYFSDPEVKSPHKYWEGCNPSDNSALVEGLFIGKYTVLEDCTNNFACPF